ncbi:MAG: alaS, partial [Chitinophagaceae bacterium]|nr:alaS [Chitinophagaceae bacterium]
PCTEIHVDCRSDDERKLIDGKTLVNNDHPQVIEIWNNVFIQFNRLKDGGLESLPAKHVDTGMGFERLVRVLQNKQSNYDTDIFAGTIAETERITGKKYDADAVSTGKRWKEAVAFRVIADHIRAISFTIADGQLPSNTGAGYVIRRILRRAVRYYYSYLDYKQPLLHQLVPLLAKQFENVFPGLNQQSDFVIKVIKEEEEAFLRTLGAGLVKLDSYIRASIKERNTTLIEKGVIVLNDNKKDDGMAPKENADIPKLEQTIDGKFAFELNDTFGFPLDLTQLIVTEKGWSVDKAGFEVEMQQQKERSRAATKVETEDWIVLDDFARNEFVGYDALEAETKVVKYRKVKAKNKEAYQLVLEITPFYAESGGQVGDTGTLNFDGEVVEVTDTKKENNLIIHFTDRLPVKYQETLIAKVDITKRKNTELHHSATHLLHAALRRVLGNHVAQKGSLVNEEHLRFDFSHFAKVSEVEIAKVETLVNEKIRENIPVVITKMPKEEALKLGAMALFGEKYGDTVRVVIMDPGYSVELCGGTHVGSTGELGFFKIKHEMAVAAGVRRVEAVSGRAAEHFVNEQLQVVHSIRESLKNPKDLAKAIENISNENAELKKKLERAEAKQLVAIRNELLTKDEIIGGVAFVGDIVQVSNPDALKKICFDLKNNLHDHLVVLCANIDGKPFVAIGISDTVVAAKNLDAGKIIKEQVAPLIKGGGGGQKNLATAGGQDTSNLKKVIESVRKLLG